MCEDVGGGGARACGGASVCMCECACTRVHGEQVWVCDVLSKQKKKW